MSLNFKTKHIPLKHFNERPQGVVIDTIVIHSMYNPDGSGPARLNLDGCVECLDKAKVSAHYLIAQDGNIVSSVPEEKRAWHAGVSRMPSKVDNRENVNDFSIGIELIADAESGISAEQYKMLAKLTRELLKRHPITNFVGHDDISPGRKIDPGEIFDWKRYLKEIEVKAKFR